MGTTGVIVAAKNAKSLEILQKAFAERRVKKSYLAICVGDPTRQLPQMREEPGSSIEPGQQEQGGVLIDAPIGRHRGDKKKMAILEIARGGRAARSIVRKLGGNAARSVLHVTIETGRTHQIRVHLQSVQSPLLGDPLYGYRDVNRECAESGIRRPMLHAWRLQVPHPTTGEWLDVTAPPPDDLRRSAELLTTAESAIWMGEG